MSKCLKCETERRAREVRCEKCGFPFSHYSTGQLIKPGNYQLDDVTAWGDCELLWKAQWRKSNADMVVQIRELAPPSAVTADVRAVCRDWSQACHNSGTAIPKLLDFFTERHHYYSVWTAETLVSAQYLGSESGTTTQDLETLWKAALMRLKTLHEAGAEFCHGDLRTDTIQVLPGNSDCVRFGPPSLLAYAETRSGRFLRSRDLQLLGAAFLSAIASRQTSDMDCWRGGSAQAGLEWCCGDNCDAATSVPGVLALMEEVDGALDSERLGALDRAREGYAKAAAMAPVPFLEAGLRRCQDAPNSAPQPPIVIAERQEQKTAPPVAAPAPVPSRPKTSQRMAVIPREPDQAAEETTAKVPDPDGALERVEAAGHSMPEVPSQVIEIVAAVPANRTPPHSTPILAPPPPPPDAKTDPDPAAAQPNPPPKPPAQTPARTQPKAPPATKSGQIIAVRTCPKMRAAALGGRRWMVMIGGVALLAIVSFAWLFHPNSLLSRALALVQADQLASTDKTKPSAYGLYRQAIEEDGPKSSTVRAIADAAKPKLDERIRRALSADYADSNKDVNWAEMSVIAQWRRELSQDAEPRIVAEALFCRGMQDLEGGQLTEAVQAFDGSQEAAPTWALPKNGKARAFFRQGRRNDAEAVYKEAAQLDPKWPEPHLNLGNLYMQSFNDLDRAEREYQDALQIQPDLPVANYDLGVLYQAKGAEFYSRSCEALQRATATANPRGLDAHMVGYAKELRQIVCR